MTDKPKTIQEALAEVQRKINEEQLAKAIENWDYLDEATKAKIDPKWKDPKTYIKDVPETKGSVRSGFSKLTPGAKSRAAGLATTAARTIGAPAVGAGIGFLAGKAAEKVATGTETGRNVGKWIGDNVPGAKTAADALKPVGDEIRRTFGAEVPKRASDTTPATPSPSTSAAPKTETPKMTFNQAYAKARDLAKSAGKDPNVAQFKFDRGGGEKVYQAAATKKDYVPMSKQFKVDIGSAPKDETLSEPTKVKSTTEPPMPANVGPDTTKFNKPESESGGKKKKMSEENINETAFGSAFAAARKAGKSTFSFGGKSFNTKLASSSPTKPSGPQGAPGLVGPGARVTRLDAPLPPSRPNPQGPRQPAEQGPPIPKTDNVPGSSTGDVTPRPSTTPPINQTQQKPLQPVDSSAGQSSDISGTMRIGSKSSGTDMPITRPEIVAKANKESNIVEPESGGKKKKMSEENNSLIASFLALQAKNPSNMFEAAKKLSKKQKEKMDVDDDNDIDADDLAMLRSKKKVDEASMYDGKNPFAPGGPKSPIGSGGSENVGPPVTSTPAKPSAPVHVKPTNPEKLKNLKDPRDPSVQGSGDVTYKEEVTFSQAEIDHINSFFLEASVAPTRPEVATGADSTSDKMSQNDVTGTSTESGKRKVKEEVELDEAKEVEYKGYVLKQRPFDTDVRVYKNGKHIQKHYSFSMKDAKDSIDFEHGTKNVEKEEKPVREEALAEHKSMDGHPLKPGDSVGYKEGHEKYGKIHSISPEGHAKLKVWDGDRGQIEVTKHVSRLWKETNEETILEGRPKKNPTPETTERDPRKHIQVEAGRAAAGNVVDFTHNDGSKSKITPAMGRRITSHLNNLKPADRQSAVNAMHASAEGLKV